jgi:hypothetical protein
MTSVTISIQASVDGDDAKTIKADAAMTCSSVITGRQTVGTTYEAATWASPGAIGTFIFNAGESDISIRCQLGNFTTNEYVFYAVPPGGIFSIPNLHMSDNGQPTLTYTIAARSASGTCDIDYCILF